MYLISYLLEKYIKDKNSLNCRRDLLYLKGLTEEISGCDISCPDDVSCVCDTFEKLVEDLGLLNRFSCEVIDRDLLVKVALEEYRNGSFDSACEFLYYKPYVSEAIEFPHKIIYSSQKDEYYISGMTSNESEAAALNLLSKL